MNKSAQAWAEKMRNGTPAERREMINSIPDPAMRDVVRQKLKDQGSLQAWPIEPETPVSLKTSD